MSEGEIKDQTDDFTDDTRAELVRLQRQFRLLENERRAYRENSENILRKLKKTLTKLKKENEELMKEHKLAFSKKNQNNEFQITEELKDLLLAEDCAKHDLTELTKKLELVNKDIKNFQKMIDLFRKHLGGSKESETKSESIQKLNKIMENRLNGANFKLNNSLTVNNKMKQEIDDLKIQRDKYLDLKKKLQKKYDEGRARKKFLIENAKTHFNNRDEAQHRLQLIRERFDRDVTAYNAELKDLLRVIDHENKLRHFMDTKMEERAESYDVLVKERIQKKLFGEIRALNADVENYENVFKQLFKVEATENIDEMIVSFKKEEEELFALYNFVKEQSKDIEVNENLMQSINKQKTSFNAKQLVGEDKLNESLKKIQVKKNKLNAEMQNTSSIILANQEKLTSLIPVVERVLFNIQSIHSKVRGKLGCSRITQNNLILFLGLIEQSATEILRAKTMLSAKSPVNEPKKNSLLAVGKVMQYLVTPPSISLEISDCYSPTPTHESAIMSLD